MATIQNDRDKTLAAESPRFTISTQGKALLLTSSTPVFHADGAGAGTPASIMVTATPLNIAGTVAFTVDAGSTITVAGNTATLAFADMTTATTTIHASITENLSTYLKDIVISKVIDGFSAPLLTLMASGQAFTYNGAGTATPTSQSLTFTANLQNVTGTAVFTCTKYDSAGTNLGTVTLSGSGNVRTLDAAGFTIGASYAIITAVLGVLTDTTTVVRLQDGVSALAGYLTNEAQLVPAANDGSAPDFTGSNGTFKVFLGTTDVTASCTYAIVGSPIVTTAAPTAATGAYSVTAAGTWATTANTTSVTYRATYGSSTIDKVFTLSKSKAGGVGVDGKRGTINIAAAGYPWSDATAVAAISTAGFGSPANMDIVTLYDATHSTTKYYNGASWLAMSAYVNGNMLVSGTVTAAQITANTITAGQIAATTITATQIAATTITAAQIAANTITAAQISANTITATQLVAGTITANEIAALTITGAKIAAGTVTASNIDSRGLSIKDAAGNVILAAGTALDYTNVGGTKPPSNATNGATTTEAAKLAGIAAGATVGADWALNVAGSTAVNNSITTAAGTSTWSGTSGTGKPADNATVGANSSNLSVGVGGNMVSNSDLSGGISNWITSWNAGGVANVGPVWDLAGFSWTPDGGHQVGVVRVGTDASASNWFDIVYKVPIHVMPNTRYEFSAYLASHRGPVSLNIVWYKLDGAGTETYVTESGFPRQTTNDNGGQVLSSWERVTAFVTVPATATYCKIYLRGWATTSTNPYFWGTRFFMGQAGPAQTEFSPWSAGGSAGTFSELSQITQTNASTYIANAAITNAQIGSLSVNSIQLMDGAALSSAVASSAFQQFYPTTPSTGEWSVTTSDSSGTYKSSGRASSTHTYIVSGTIMFSPTSGSANNLYFLVSLKSRSSTGVVRSIGNMPVVIAPTLIVPYYTYIPISFTCLASALPLDVVNTLFFTIYAAACYGNTGVAVGATSTITINLSTLITESKV